MVKYPYGNHAPDVVAVMSHAHRLLMNALFNDWRQQRQETKKFLPWTKGSVAGATMQPQSCYIWPGIVVTGCTRGAKGRAGNVTNGVYYIVKSFDNDGCTLQMHPDYAKNYVAKVERNFPKLAPLIAPLVQYLKAAPRSEKEFERYPGLSIRIDKALTARQALQSLGFVAVNGHVVVPAHFAAVENDADVAPSLSTEIVGPVEFYIDWPTFQVSLRLTHALPYVYFQGKTVAKQLFVLMNVESRHFTMRHLIMGLGRAQKGENVQICARGKERRLLRFGKEAFEKLEQLARQMAETHANVAEFVVDTDGDVIMDADDAVSTAVSPDGDRTVEFDDVEDDDATDFSDSESVGVVENMFADEEFDA